MDIFISALPILLVVLGLGILNKPAIIVAPIVMIVTALFGVYYFNAAWGDVLKIFVWQKGVIEGLKTGAMLWGAFSILKFMQNTGAVNKIQEVLADLTHDKRAHVIIIAIFLGTFFEGAAGAGSPAAVCAPLLIGLGYEPMTAAVVCLIANCVPVSWGAAGVTTINAAANTPVNEYMSIIQASASAGRIHRIGALVIMFIAVLFVFGKGGLKNLVPYLIINSILYCLFIWFISMFVTELTSLLTGMIMIAFNILLFKAFKFKINTPDEFVYEPNLEALKESKQNTFQAFFPYILLCIVIPVFRFTVPFPFLAKVGFTFWISWCMFFTVIVSAFVLKGGTKVLFKSIKDAFVSVLPSVVAIICMIVMAQIMNGVGMTMNLASFLGGVGNLYPALAVIIGVVGSFVSGTAATSNVMFGTMHCQAATGMAMNPIPVFGAQSAGAALGNMICPHNVVAVATTTGQRGQEGTLMRKVALPFLIILIVYMAIALLNTNVLYTEYPGIQQSIPAVLNTPHTIF